MKRSDSVLKVGYLCLFIIWGLLAALNASQGMYLEATLNGIGALIYLVLSTRYM